MLLRARFATSRIYESHFAFVSFLPAPVAQLGLFGMSTQQQLQRLTKRRIALIQMEQSLNMLEAGDPVSALTLAGAAEEILGSIDIQLNQNSEQAG